jgi:hypothetical protein
MTSNEWESLQENAVVSCHVQNEGEICYQLTIQDHMNRWIAMRLDKANYPVKAIVLLSRPEIFARVEN